MKLKKFEKLKPGLYIIQWKKSDILWMPKYSLGLIGIDGFNGEKYLSTCDMNNALGYRQIKKLKPVIFKDGFNSGTGEPIEEYEGYMEGFE